MMSSQFKAALEQDGFLIVPECISSDAAASLAEKLSARAVADTANPDQIYLNNIVETHPDFFHLPASPYLLELMKSVMGDRIHLIMNYGHIKPRQTPAHTGTHSDVAHLAGVKHHTSDLMYKCVFALTDIDKESAPTRVIPGSHRRAFNQVATGEGIYTDLIAKAGDLIVFNSNIQHTASPNTSDRDRISLWYTFAQSWMRAFPGHEASPMIQHFAREQRNPNYDKVYGLEHPYATI